MKKIIKTEILGYNFDTSDPEEKQKYTQLRNSLKRQGLSCFFSRSPSRYSKDYDRYQDKLKAVLAKGFINLEIDTIFSDQWNSAEPYNLRVFDWYEPVLENKKIKRGYYLIQTPEMKHLRKTSTRCQYCGKVSLLKDCKGSTCPHCKETGYLLDLTQSGMRFLVK
jgi:hypothetical protein